MYLVCEGQRWNSRVFLRYCRTVVWNTKWTRLASQKTLVIIYFHHYPARMISECLCIWLIKNVGSGSQNSVFMFLQGKPFISQVPKYFLILWCISVFS